MRFQLIDVPELSLRDTQVARVLGEYPEVLDARDYETGENLAHVCARAGNIVCIETIGRVRPAALAAADLLGALPEDVATPGIARRLREFRGERG